ncbi:restriction endonuclease subunit S [Pseudodesulfovibrio methanolicus]|uniref:Restriction endonuclease subunit S n=1 Tax=Pseudodesulfovibrio methanolicus TaxID=3126690 RepID=A0ABZ2J082_9BACT
MIHSNGSWKDFPLGEICENLDSKRIPITKAKRDSGSIPYYGASGIVDYVADYLFDEDLLLVSEDGANLLARTYPIAFSINGKTWVNNHAHVLRFKNHDSQRFVEYYLNSISLEPYVSGMAQPKLNQKKLNSIPVPFPSLPEQQRIVAILDDTFERIDAAIANTEKNLANARELFESYLNDVFSQRGEGWEECPLEELSEKITKGSSPKWQGVAYVDEPGILFITSENVGSGKMLYNKTKYVDESFNDKDSKSILCKGDVLTNIVGASIGRTAVFDRDDLSNINQAVCMIRCIKDKLSNRYLSYLLNSPYFIRFLHDNEIDNARANLSLTFFRELMIPIPSLEVQEELVSKMDAMSEECVTLESLYRRKLQALAELKQSILQKVFAGELTAGTNQEALVN